MHFTNLIFKNIVSISENPSKYILLIFDKSDTDVVTLISNFKSNTICDISDDEIIVKCDNNILVSKKSDISESSIPQLLSHIK